MHDLAESHPDSALFFHSSPDRALENFIYYCVDLFYNMDTGQCEFDSQEFVELLETAQTLPLEYDSGGSKDAGHLLQSEKILLYHTAIFGLYDLPYVEENFGSDDILYVGYPCGGENGSIIHYNRQWSISAQSGNMEGAWEFIKVLFTEDVQKSGDGMPMIEKYFDEEIAEDMQETDKDGRMKFHVPTEEQAQLLRSLVYSATRIKSCDTAIYTIITEEAQAFFAGQKTAEEVAALIQNRALNYVEEKKE